MVRIVLVGCGNIASGVHLPALDILRQRGAVDIVGVADLDAKRAQAAATKFAVAHYGTDWLELVGKTGAQALSICLPPGPNVEVAVGALERGLHVMTEKPPARDLKGGARLAEAAAVTAQLVTMVAFNRLFAPLYVKLMQMATRLGPPHVFSGRFTRPGLGTGPSDTAADWITSDGSHALDLAIATLGDPQAFAVNRRLVGSGPDNVWTIQFHMQQGSAVLVLDFAAGRRVERFEISGPGYDAVLELPGRGEWAQQGGDTQQWQSVEETQTESAVTNYGYLGEYCAFMDAIQGKTPRPAADFAYAARFMHLVRQILDCSNGEWRAVRRVDLTVARRAPIKVEAVAGDTARTTPGARPIVAIWQHPAAQSKFFTQHQLTELREKCELRLRAENSPAEKEIGQTDALVLGWDAPVLTPELIDKAKQLKLVVVIGASVRQVHPELLLSRGILLCSTSDAIAQSVAEHCLLGALAGRGDGH